MYLEHNETYMMELFYENSQRLFTKKANDFFYENSQRLFYEKSQRLYLRK